MRIVDVREKTFPISSPIRNAYIDVSSMTTQSRDSWLHKHVSRLLRWFGYGEQFTDANRAGVFFGAEFPRVMRPYNRRPAMNRVMR